MDEDDIMEASALPRLESSDNNNNNNNNNDDNNNNNDDNNNEDGDNDDDDDGGGGGGMMAFLRMMELALRQEEEEEKEELNRPPEELFKLFMERGMLARCITLLRKGSVNPATTAVHGFVPDVRALQDVLNMGCSLNALDDNGLTLLHHAIIGGSLEAVTVLLTYGADARICLPPGLIDELPENASTLRLAYYFACERGALSDEPLVRKVVLGAEAEAEAGAEANSQRELALARLKLLKSSSNEVKIILRLQRALNLRPRAAPLLVASDLATAVKYGDLEAAKRYLATQSPAQMVDDMPLLLFAAKCFDRSMVRLLLQAKADVNVLDDDGWTALHYFSSVNDSQMAKELVRAKADVNARSNAGYTPLYDFVAKGNLTMIKSLVEHGANVTEACTKSPSLVHHLIEAAPSQIGPVLHFLMQSCGPDLNLDLKDDGGNTALHLAAQKDYLDVVEILLAKGARVHNFNNENKTPIEIAEDKNNKHMAVALRNSILATASSSITTLYDCYAKIDSSLGQHFLELAKAAPCLCLACQQAALSLGSNLAETPKKAGKRASASASASASATATASASATASSPNNPCTRQETQRKLGLLLELLPTFPHDKTQLRGWTAMHWIVWYGLDAVLDKYLSIFPSPDLLAANSATLLHVAILADRLDMAQALCKAGANCLIDASIPKEMTVDMRLPFIPMPCNAVQMTFLVHRQVSKTGSVPPRWRNSSAILEAVRAVAYEQALMKGRESDFDNDTAMLYAAVCSASISKVHSAINESLPDLNCLDSSKFPLLIQASGFSAPALIDILVRAGASPESCTQTYFSNVLDAAALRSLELTKRAVTGLKLQATRPRPKDGLTPLHRAAMGWADKPLEIVKFLCETAQPAAAVTAKSHALETPLFFAVDAVEPDLPAAVVAERLSIVRYLCRHPRTTKADLTARNSDGLSLFHKVHTLEVFQELVKAIGDASIIKELLNRPSNAGRTPLMSAAAVAKDGTNSGELIKAMLQSGADLKFSGPYNGRQRWDALMEALAHRNAECALLLLSEGAEADYFVLRKETKLELCYSGGTSPLLLAAEKGLTSVIAALVDNAKIDVDARDGSLDAYTPLMKACSFGELEAVKALVERGSNPNLYCKAGGLTPLKLAVGNERMAVVEYLLKHCPTLDPNFVWTDYRYASTALHQAVRSRYTHLVKPLLAHPKIDINKDNFFETPLSSATSSSPEILSLLCNDQRIDLCVTDRNGMSPLDIARQLGNNEAERILDLAQRRAGCRPSRQITYKSALQAALVKDWEFLEKVVAEGGDNAAQLLDDGKTDSQKWTLLHWAARSGQAVLIKDLLQRGKIDVNAQDETGKTALHIAVTYQQLAAMECLLDWEGTDANIHDHERNTPFIVACQNGNLPIVKALMSHHPRVRIDFPRACHGNDGRYPIEFCKDGTACVDGCGNPDDTDFFETARLVAAHPATKPNSHRALWAGLATPFHEFCRNREICRALLCRPDADINSATRDGFTPLILGAQMGHPGIGYMVLARPGVDVNLTLVTSGASALYYAASLGHVEMLRELLRAPEIDLLQTTYDVKTGEVSSPLIAAAKNGHLEALELLLDCGRDRIDVNIADHQGQTPLMLAVMNKHTACVSLLLQHKPDVALTDMYGLTATTLALASQNMETAKQLQQYEEALHAEQEQKESEKRLAEMERLQNQKRQDQEENAQIFAEMKVEHRLKSQLTAAMSHIDTNPLLNAFYYQFKFRISSVLASYQSLASGMVQRTASTAEKVFKVFTLFGESIPIPGINVIFGGVDFVIVTIEDRRQKKVANFMMRLINHGEGVDIESANAARLVTFRYEWHISQLQDANTALAFADCVFRHYLHVVNQHDHAGMDHCDSLPRHMLQCLALPPASSHKDVPLPRRMQTSGSEGAAPWTDRAILHRSGIITDTLTVFVNADSQPSNCGLRLADTSEVQSMAFSRLDDVASCGAITSFWEAHALHDNPFRLALSLRDLLLPSRPSAIHTRAAVIDQSVDPDPLVINSVLPRKNCCILM